MAAQRCAHECGTRQRGYTTAAGTKWHREDCARCGAWVGGAMVDVPEGEGPKAKKGKQR